MLENENAHRKTSMQLVLKSIQRSHDKMLPKIYDTRSNVKANAPLQIKKQQPKQVESNSAELFVHSNLRPPVLFQMNFDPNKTYFQPHFGRKNKNQPEKYSLVSVQGIKKYSSLRSKGNNTDFSGIHNFQERLEQMLMNSNLAHSLLHPQTIQTNLNRSLLQPLEPKSDLSETLFSTVQDTKSMRKKSQFKRNLNFSNHDNSFKFYIGPGNNGELVRRILENRQGWSQTSESNSIFNFRWTQKSENSRLDRMLHNSSGCMQVLNHFDFHQQITTKSGLIRNLRALCERQQKAELFEITPITFEIDFRVGENCEHQMKRFLHFFIDNLPVYRNKSVKKQEERKMYTDFVKKIKPIYHLQNHTYQKREHPNSKPLLKQVYTQGDTYLWLLKPNGLNRGRGIYLFRTLEELGDILLEYYERNERSCSPTKRQIATTKENTRQAKQNPEQQINNNDNIRSQSFVIQKYIQKPMLIHGRKYDIRVWVLLTNEAKLYFFKEGYIRTSCQGFDVNKKDLYVHLTNNAVQKHSKNYGEYEKGNQLSFDDLESIFQQQPVNLEQQRISFRANIIPEMKKIICLSIESVKKRIPVKDKKVCFQIFGYDFMIDQFYKLWLIEINTNPCIEESSPLLENLLPRMLDDAFALTLDIIFHNKKKNVKYSVQKYDDNENMWEMIGNFREEKAKKR